MIHRGIGGGIVGLLVCAAGLIALPPSFARLHAARMRGATLEADVAAGAPRMPPLLLTGAAIEAPDRKRAGAMMLATLRAVGVREGVLVERLAQADAHGAQAIVSAGFVLSGAPDRVMRFAETIENRTPVIRIAHWRLAPLTPAGAGLRLEGEAVAIWTRRE